jgi:hypothetical protein
MAFSTKKKNKIFNFFLKKNIKKKIDQFNSFINLYEKT